MTQSCRIPVPDIQYFIDYVTTLLQRHNYMVSMDQSDPDPESPWHSYLLRGRWLLSGRPLTFLLLSQVEHLLNSHREGHMTRWNLAIKQSLQSKCRKCRVNISFSILLEPTSSTFLVVLNCVILLSSHTHHTHHTHKPLRIMCFVFNCRVVAPKMMQMSQDLSNKIDYCSVEPMLWKKTRRGRKILRWDAWWTNGAKHQWIVALGRGPCHSTSPLEQHQRNWCSCSNCA